MSSITCVCGTEEDSWPTISCTKCLFLHHVKCVGNEGQDLNTFVCLPCKSLSVMPKSREPTEKQTDNADHSGDEEDKEGQETTHYTAVQSTPTCLTITSSKIDKISRNSSRKRRNKGKEDQRKVKKQRYDITEIKSPIKPTNCFGPSKLQDAEILYKELAENIYSDGLTRMLNLFQADLNKTNNQVSLKNMETRKLKVQQTEYRRLVTMDNIGGDEAIVEMRGSYMLHDEYEETITQPLSPTQQQQSTIQHVFMYNGLEGLNICVDARTHGNVSRFVRFSPNPNTELRHVMNNNKVRLYLFTKWQLIAGDEITLPITTFDDWCGGSVKVEMSTSSSTTSGDGLDATSCNNKLLTINNNEIDEKQQHDFRRLSPLKLTIPKPTTNPQQQKTKPCGMEQSNNLSDNVDEIPPSLDNAANRMNNKSASICARSTTESGKVSSTPEQTKSKNRKRGRATNRRPRDNSQSTNDNGEQRDNDQFDTQENCDRQSTDSATTSHQSCDLTSSQDDVTTGGGMKAVCYDNSVEGVDSSKNMKIDTPDTKSSKMKAKKNSKAPAVDIPSWFVDDCTHPLPLFRPGCPPEGGFRVQIQIKEVALPSKSKSTNKPPKKHFLATARNDENLISETTEVALTSDVQIGGGQKTPPSKKLFLRRYKEANPDQQQQSSSHVLENLTNDADLTTSTTTAGQPLNTCEDSSSSGLGEPMAITVITTNRNDHDPMLVAPSLSGANIAPNTPTPAKKKMSLSEYLSRRKRTKPSDDKNKQQKSSGEGTESPVQADEDSSSRASSSRKSSVDERSSQQSINERTESNPIPIIQLNSSRDSEKPKAAYCPPPPSFRINIDTPTKPQLPSTPGGGADVKQRSSSLNHTTPRRREPSTDSALLPTPSLIPSMRPGTAKSLMMNEKLSPHSSSVGGPPPYNPTAPATMPRVTPNKKQQQAINRCQSRGNVRKISSPTPSPSPINRSSLSNRTSADSIYNGRGRRNSPTHIPSWESPRHSSIIRMDEYSRRGASPPKYPPPPLDRGHHQHPADIFTEWDASLASFPSDPPHFTYAPAPSRSSPTHRGRSPPPPQSTVPPHNDPKIANQSPFRRHTADYYAYKQRGSGGGESSDKSKYYYAPHESGGYHRR